MSRRVQLLASAWVVGLLMLGGIAGAGDPEDPAEQEIRRLWQELQVLMDSLPEDRRVELWRELTAVKTADAEPSEPKADVPDNTEPVIREPRAADPPVEPVAADPPAVEAERAEDAEDLRSTPGESAPVATEEVRSQEPKDPPVRSRRACNVLDPFDSDGDQKLTGLDRYWRHFYLWLDRNEDGRIGEKELEPPYERGVRAIQLSARSFVRGKKKRARELEILDEQYLLLDLDGNGWQGARPTAKDGALAVDFDALKFSGGPSFLDGSGSEVQGIQPFRPGWSYLAEDGKAVEVRCPRP